MAMLYISHSDETERNARILRVRQGIEDNARESSSRLIKITNEIDKGKGHVFHFPENINYQGDSSKLFRAGAQLLLGSIEDEAESSAKAPDTMSAPILGSSGFQLGPSSEGRASGNLSLGKAPRIRPPYWKRKANSTKRNSVAGPALKDQDQTATNGSKRKQKRDDPKRSRFFFDKRYLNKAGIEEIIKESWGTEGLDQSNTMEHIGRCRKSIMKWK
ncbi:hypothetical protein HID58_082442, partial [Brassica napus]